MCNVTCLRTRAEPTVGGVCNVVCLRTRAVCERLGRCNVVCLAARAIYTKAASNEACVLPLGAEPTVGACAMLYVWPLEQYTPRQQATKLVCLAARAEPTVGACAMLCVALSNIHQGSKQRSLCGWRAGAVPMICACAHVPLRPEPSSSHVCVT